MDASSEFDDTLELTIFAGKGDHGLCGLNKFVIRGRVVGHGTRASGVGGGWEDALALILFGILKRSRQTNKTERSRMSESGKRLACEETPHPE